MDENTLQEQYPELKRKIGGMEELYVDVAKELKEAYRFSRKLLLERANVEWARKQTYFRRTEFQEGDEIWLFDNDLWHLLAGRRGYMLIRDGKQVDWYLSAMN